MRITTSMIYDQALSSMQDSLADVTRLTEQTASQKSVNSPSDDPSGYALSLDLKTTISGLEQYEENIETAESWLTLTDSVLGEISDLLTSIEELAEQGATGTYDADQRAMMAEEVRELFEQLVTLCNTEYAGSSIFSGSMTDTNAYTIGLGATVRNASNASNSSLTVSSVTGESDSTIYVEFEEDGVVGVDEISYRYTDDGGDTWSYGTLEAGETTLDLGSAEAELEAGSEVVASSEEGEGDGTLVWIRPAAYYQGDTTDGLETYYYGSSDISYETSGDFDSTVTVRIDSASSADGTITYSYSTDSGSTWVTGNTTSNATLYVPGGFIDLTSSNASGTVSSGDQFVIQPSTAEISVQIGSNSDIVINTVGKDVFGGLYYEDGESDPTAADTSDGANMLETVAELIGYLETNDIEGISQCIDGLDEAHEVVTSYNGEIGGRETRLEYAANNIEVLTSVAETGISNIEDADYTQLATDLAMAEYIYEAVLESSAKIMSLSLIDYI